MSRRSFWILIGVLGLLSIICSAHFIGANLAYNHEPVAPLDDTYIHFQYAKQLARGFFFRYFDDDPVSTGGTSFLYPVLLAPFWKAGLRGESLLWAGHLLNTVGLFLSACFLFVALLRLLPKDRVLAFLGGVLLILNGWFMWGIASGMAIGVMAASLSLTLLGATLYFKEGRVTHLAVGMALLMATRPEGLVLGWATMAAVWIHGYLGGSSPAPVPEGASWRARSGSFASRVLKSFTGLSWPLWAGVGAGTLPFVLLALASGHLTTNGMLVKSHFANDMDWVRYFWESGRTLAAIPGRLLWSPSSVAQGMMAIFAVAGVAALLRGGPNDGRSSSSRSWGLGLVVAACFAAILCFYGFLMEHIEHHNRYYMPYLPLVTLVLVVGIQTVTRPFPRWIRRSLSRTAIVFLCVLGIGSVWEWARIYAHNCADIRGHYLPMSRWMRANLPAKAEVAVHDAGALPYLGGHKCYDMLGLVTNAFRVPGGSRADGFIWEVLERIKPRYMIIYPNFFGMLSRLRILRRIHSERIPRVTIAGGQEKVAFEIDWSKLLPSGRPYGLPSDKASWKVRDSLDTADLKSEKAHDYRVDHGRFRGASRFRLGRFGAADRMLIDGGRAFSRYESFVVRNLVPGRPLLIGVRSSSGAVLKVSMDGKKHSFWEVRGKGQAGEVYMTIDGSAVRRSRARFSFSVDGPGEFASYHYFFLQPP